MILDAASKENSVLILAPVGQDAVLAAKVLARAGISSEVCAELEVLCAKLKESYGAALIAEEALSPSAITLLNQALSGQPAWSDIPVILLTGSGMATDASVRAWRNFASIGNVTLLERPLKTATIVSSAHVALRARRRQYQVRHLLEEQRMATELRDDFISIASHELKTPITAMKLQLQLNRKFVDRLDGEPVPADRVRKLIDSTEQVAERLNRLVDDMLDSTRIQAGKLTFDFEPVNLSDAVEQLIERNAAKLASSGNSLALELERDVTGTWDKLRLEQVLTNLLSNAQRYAPNTPLKLSVRRWRDQVRIEVEDRGPGIPLEMIDKIFERFERGKNERIGAGLGLGLFICREIIRGHKGSIHAESEPGRGAKFVIELPISETVASRSRIS